MSRSIASNPVASPWPGRIACLALLSALAGCGGQPSHHAARHYDPSRYYPPPGPRTDPWGPYIHEASGRFGVPELWIRRVMRQESGGQEDVISWAGAMGLMQVMPDTYDGLRGRYSLGDDPFDPHNNILAGTAYLREMYDRFGAPGFLAAYNAGPNRLDRYLNRGTPLPDETVNYVASIAPLLGPGTPMSGPLAVYAGSQFAARPGKSGCDPDAAFNPDGACTPTRATVVQFASAAPAYGNAGCDPDAAYDPSHPCVPARPASVQRMTVAAAAPAYASAGCDSDAAYDPSRPCAPARPASVKLVAVAAAAPAFASAGCDPDAAFDPSRPCQPLPPSRAPVFAEPPPRAAIGNDAHAKHPTGQRPLQETVAQQVAYQPVAPPGRWAIQVGAFANLATAEAAAENARMALPDLLRTAKIELPATTPFGSQVAFRARLLGLSQSGAADVCGRLGSRGIPCITVPPDRGSF
jgi:hypothetical protein